jgi:PhzF family phenazine biosynthesis protein
MRQWTIDAFASEPFKGNPACVVEPMTAWPAAERMQALAAENNQAETAFLVASDDPARFGLRWFTPALEVPLCGHATLASAHLLFGELGAGAEAISFDTLSGPLMVSRSGGGYRMDFPATTPQLTAAPPGLTEALGADLVEVWAAQYLVAIVADEDAVRALKPDLAALKHVASAASGGRGNVGVSAIARPGSGYDVVSRCSPPSSAARR